MPPCESQAVARGRRPPVPEPYHLRGQLQTDEKLTVAIHELLVVEKAGGGVNEHTPSAPKQTSLA